MQHSKEAIKFADKLIVAYAEWDKSEDQYTLDVGFMGDHDLNRLAAIIMSKNEYFVSEACGPDNPAFDKYMRCQLINTMKDSESLSMLEELAVEWIHGVYEYMKEEVEELLDARLREYNYNTRNVNNGS